MVIVRAPVRVSFGGGGTDLAAYYAHFGGLVVSTAITRYCSVVVCPSVDGSIRIHSADYRTWEMYPRGEIPPVEGILSLPKVAIAHFADLGLRKKGVDLYLFSEVPPGSGLGSSSAMAVALVRALAAHVGLVLSACGPGEPNARRTRTFAGAGDGPLASSTRFQVCSLTLSTCARSTP